MTHDAEAHFDTDYVVEKRAEIGKEIGIDLPGWFSHEGRIWDHYHTDVFAKGDGTYFCKAKCYRRAT